MKRGSLVISAAFATAGMSIAALAVAEPSTMDREEIARSIIGNTLVGSFEGAPYAEYYAPDGVIRGESKDGRYRAEWWLRGDDTMCFKYGEAVDGYWPGGCVRLSLDGDTVNFIRLDGSVEAPAKLVAGNARGL